MKQDPLISFLEKRTPRRFAAVVEAHRDEVLNAAFRVLGERTAAEDVAQEVFLKLLTVIPDTPVFEPPAVVSEEGSVWSWYGLPEGRYLVAADTRNVAAPRSGFAYEGLTVRAGSGSVERTILLPPAGELLIEARDASGRRFAGPGPTIHLERADGGPAVPPHRLGGEAWRRPDPRVFEGRVDDSGILHLQGVPVGHYRIDATRPGFQPAWAEAEVEEGRRADVVMTLTR